MLVAPGGPAFVLVSTRRTLRPIGTRGQVENGVGFFDGGRVIVTRVKSLRMCYESTMPRRVDPRYCNNVIDANILDRLEDGHDEAVDAILALSRGTGMFQLPYSVKAEIDHPEALDPRLEICIASHLRVKARWESACDML